MTNSIETLALLKLTSRHGFADVWLDPSSGQRSLHAAKQLEAGEVLIKFSAGIIQSYATYLTVQTGVDTHITLQPEFLQYCNHSCDPNAFFDTSRMEFITLKAVQPGDELSFFYPSTEWQMSQPFVCNCKSSQCLQLISGAAHLDRSTLEKYRLTDFIRLQLEQRIPA